MFQKWLGRISELRVGFPHSRWKLPFYRCEPPGLRPSIQYASFLEFEHNVLNDGCFLGRMCCLVGMDAWLKQEDWAGIWVPGAREVLPGRRLQVCPLCLQETRTLGCSFHVKQPAVSRDERSAGHEGPGSEISAGRNASEADSSGQSVTTAIWWLARIPFQG